MACPQRGVAQVARRRLLRGLDNLERDFSRFCFAKAPASLGASSKSPRGADAPRKNLRYFFFVACGAAACVVLISVLRTLWYEWMGLRPQMSPRMFIVFSPILAAAYATVGLVCEGLLALLAPSFTGARPFAVGASYGLLFIALRSRCVPVSRLSGRSGPQTDRSDRSGKHRG